jgi:putative ABC transport system permease protein
LILFSNLFSQTTWRLSLRMLSRDWRAGELRVLLAAIIIAVACVTSVSFFTDRIQQALNYQSGELLGADLRVVADHPLPALVSATVTSNNLRTAETRSFRSMIQAGVLGAARLAEIKAVGPGYPLRGALKIAPRLFAQDQVTQVLPQPGEVWVGPQLLQQLGVKVGEPLQVGFSQLRIAAVLTYEPDRSGDMFSIAPRLLMNLSDLPATGLVQEGSHVHYRFLVAGEPSAIAQYRQLLMPHLQRGESIEGAKDARPEIRAAMQRAQQFLGLAAVVAVMLACIAIAMAARRYAQRHLDTCAMLRCLGASQNHITQLFLLQLVALSFFAGPLGVLSGFLAQEGLVALLGELIIAELPAPSWTPVWVGLLVAVSGVLGFALPPVLQLRNVPALRVLRRTPIQSAITKQRQPTAMIAYLFGFVMLALLVMYQAGDIVLGGILLSGLLLAILLLWAAAMLFTLSLKVYLQRLLNNQSATRQSATWHFGLINLTRNTRAAALQVMAFGVGLMVLLLLTLVRGDLLQTWSKNLAEDAPNRFVINIQTQQLADVRAFFSQKAMGDVVLFPMVRGRLTAINHIPVSAEQYTNPRAKGLVAREFNLSWADELQTDNKIVQGQWWGQPTNDASHSAHEFSVEEGIAKTLGITLGDELTYLIAGEPFTATVSSLRSVQWDSFRANFFVLAPPGALNTYPASYITSFFLPAGKHGVLDELVKTFPNLTVIDIAAIMNQVRLIIERVSMAVEFVFLFTLAAGLLVMAAAIQSTLDVRLHENAVLRALGARRRRLWQNLAVEFFSLGALAGLLAAFFASALGFVIAHQVLEMDYAFNPWLWVLGLLGGGFGVGLAGIIGTRQVVNSPPLAVLRKL